MPSLAPSGFGSVDCVPSRHGPTGGQHPWAGAAPAREARFEVSSWWCRASGRAPHGPASITFNAQMETRNDRTDPTRTATRCRRTFLERRPQGGCHGRRRSSRRPGVRRPMCGRCSGRHRNRAQIGRDRKVGRSQRCGARLVPARRPSVRPCRSRSRPAAVRRAARTGSASHGGAGLVENLEQRHRELGLAGRGRPHRRRRPAAIAAFDLAAGLEAAHDQHLAHGMLRIFGFTTKRAKRWHD